MTLLVRLIDFVTVMEAGVDVYQWLPPLAKKTVKG